MSGDGWLIVEDVIPWAAFTLAIVVLLMVPVRKRSPFNRDAKLFFAASLMCYMIATSGSILSQLGLLPDAPRTMITVIEVLWIPLVLFGIYAMYAAQQLNDALAATEAVLRTGEMADEIAETSMAGIVVLSDSGRITFANRKAREMLALSDDPGCVGATPDLALRVCGVSGQGVPAAVGFKALLCAEPLHEAPVVVESGTGWSKRLSVNTSPFVAEDGSVGGAVAAFVEENATPGVV